MLNIKIERNKKNNLGRVFIWAFFIFLILASIVLVLVSNMEMVHKKNVTLKYENSPLIKNNLKSPSIHYYKEED